jgi:hypothetical protein
MIIHKAEASVKGERYSGVVCLTLIEKKEGWTYSVDKMGDEEFTLTWRTRTPEKATTKLIDLYSASVWDFKIITSE